MDTSSRLRRRRLPTLTLTRPMFPEGLITPLLLTAILVVTGLCIDASAWSRLVIPMGLVAGAAAGFGSILARLRVLDSLAHMLALFGGLGVVVALVVRSAESLGAGYRARLVELWRVSFDWYLGRSVPEELVGNLVSVLMGLIVWLVGYLSAWSLFRRGWPLLALVLPGFLLLVNLGYAEDPDPRWLAPYAFISLVLVARYGAYARQREWMQRQLPGPRASGGRAVIIGVVIATIATTVGWQVPSSLSQRAFQPLVEQVSSGVESAQDGIDTFIDGLAGTDASGTQEGGSYTSFGESFSVGGPLSLTNEPQALVYGDEAPYLTAQHYDTYSGRGWSSSTEATFNPDGADGRQYAPEMTFGPNQAVPLSDDVSQERRTSAVEITPLGPARDQMLTVNTYITSDVQSSVRMSWIQLENATFDVASRDLNDVPRDVRRIAFLLQSATLDGQLTNAGPAASDPVQQAEIEAERDQLLARFLDVRWQADADGTLTTLVVSGQVPVYDDVEAVYYRNDEDATSAYRVLSAASHASDEDLRGAGVAYPDWVIQRYLSLPETITPRTVGLVEQVVAGASTPYDQARAIEEYLRRTVVYDETVEAPPEGADIVDYLLFERQRGYCEYSATAMTVMLRSIGVPARVTVGFYPGDYDQALGGYLYVQRNAHAWTEVFFPGYGWIPFEPTSSRPLLETVPPANQAPPEQEDPTPLAIEEPTVPATEAPGATPDAAAPATNQEPPQPTQAGDRGGRGWLPTAMVGLALLVGLAGTSWLIWTVPLRGLTPAAGLFTRLRRVGRWLGVEQDSATTPGEYGQAFANRVPQARPHVHRIVRTYELDRYGPEQAPSGWTEAATAAWKSIRGQVPRWILRRGRG